MTNGSSNGVESVAKAAAVLQAFSPLLTTLSVRRLAERTNIPRSTTHALCRTLCEVGLLEQVPHRGYRLGPALVSLGGQVIDRTGLVTAAEGLLGRLPRRSGQEAHLGQFVDGWIVYLDRVLGSMPRPMRNRVGLRAPAFRTGCGKAALSLLQPEVVEEIVVRSCEAERIRRPDLGELARELAAVRRDGYVVSAFFQNGRTSVAAAIADVTGAPVGGVSIAGASELFTPSVVREAARSVQEVSAQISRRLADRLGTLRATSSLG